MNTRKDFIRAAALVAEIRENGIADWLPIREAFVRFFKNDNPRFDITKFREACQT